MEALKTQLQALLDDPERVARMKEKTAPYILSHYNWDIVVEQMLRIYRGEKVDYLTVLGEKERA